MPESSYYEGFRHERDVVYSDDDGHYKKTKVRRYKVDKDHVEPVDRPARGDSHGYRSSNNALDVVDYRDYGPERPRSAFEVTETSRRTERDRERDSYGGRDGAYTVEKRRDVFERDADGYGGGHGHRVVYEKTTELDRHQPRDRDGFTRARRRGGDNDDQVVVETYSEDRRDDGYGGQVDRWHKETEYYEPAPSAPPPIVIRSRPAEQRIIVQEAPAPPPVVIPRQQADVLVIREKDRRQDKADPRREDEYFYERKERREHRSGDRDDRDDELAIASFERRSDRDRPHHHHHHHRHHRDGREFASDGDLSSGDDYYMKKTTVIHHDRSPSPSHRKRHLAEGALAGAGLGALLGSRRNNETGELPEHRGRKVIAGAALGALGTEVLRRAHSAYNERFAEDDNEDDLGRARSRSRGGGGNRERSSSRHHSKLKTGLGIAAAALAVAGAAKYIQSTRVDKEERNRGRSLHRYSSDEEAYSGRSRTQSRRKSRSRSVAKVAAGTAAVAGLVHHLRSKSRQREGKARSHSRLRTGAEIAAAGLAGVAAKKLYDKRKDKKEAEHERERERDHDHDRQLSEDEYESDRRSHRSGGSRSHSRSRSLSRSAPAAGVVRAPYPPSTADAELGLVEYGTQPLYSDPPHSVVGHRDSVSRRSSYDSAADSSDRGDRRRRHRHSHRHHSGRGTDDAEDSSYADVEDSSSKPKRSRSGSRLRNLAAAGVGAAAAAIGLKTYENKKKHDESAKQHDRDNGRRYDEEEYERPYDREHDADVDQTRRREKHHRRPDEDATYDGYYDDFDNNRSPSPPHASGGAFYPRAPPVGNTGNVMQHPNANLNEPYQPYRPADFNGYPPPPGPPPAAGVPVGYPPAPPVGQVPAAPAAPPVPPMGPAVSHAAGPFPDVAQPQDTGGPYRRDSDNPIIEPRPVPPHEGDHVSFSFPLIQGVTASLPPDSSKLSKDPVNNNHTSPQPEREREGHDASPKAVGFAPLSPQSSRTLEMHHAAMNDRLFSTSDTESGSQTEDASKQSSSSLALVDPRHDSSSRHRRTSRDEDDVEVLPDRFDSHGRPLHRGGVGASSGTHGRSALTARHGDFERVPERDDGWHVRGQWGVAGTDAEKVERLSERMRGIIDDLGSGHNVASGILGLVGGVLGELAGGIGDEAIQGPRRREALEDGDEESSRGDGGSRYVPEDRKRKRRNTYDTTRGAERRGGRGDSDARHARGGHDTGGYHADGWDGHNEHETRKRRRSWTG